MGKRLEKTEYLLSIEKVLKKYGYTRMYCIGRFTDTKEPGLWLLLDGVERGDIVAELSEVVDPTWKLSDYDINDAADISCIEGLSEKDWMCGSAPVYVEGEFYAYEG